MKRKILAIGIVLLFSGLVYGYYKYIGGRMEFIKNKDTPDKFLSHVVIGKDSYAKDRIEILKRLQFFLKNHRQSFDTNIYDDSTQLSIDTILYSPSFTKIAVFVIAKFPSSRQAVPDERYEWHYNGYCYLGTKQQADSLELFSIDSGFGSHSRNKVEDMLKLNYFSLFATIKDVSGKYKYKFNLDDIRFWSCPVWKEIDDMKRERVLFEKEKKEHPENVYEPKQ